MTTPLVVELVGPVVDDGGAFDRTVRDVLADLGVVPRAGAEALVAGAGARHALATLLGGHGHDAEPELLARAEVEVERRWVALAAAGTLRTAHGAPERLRRAGAAGLLTGLPPSVATALLEGAGLGDVPIGTAGRTMPHPDAVHDLVGRLGVAPGDVTAVLGSPAAMLAAAQAGVVRIVACGGGDAPLGELVPVAARVARLADLP